MTDGLSRPRVESGVSYRRGSAATTERTGWEEQWAERKEMGLSLSVISASCMLQTHSGV